MRRRHTIGMLVEDQPGVMTRVAGLFARRGYNIDTITVGKTTKLGISKMIITVLGDDDILEQIEKQCNKLIDVIKVSELGKDDSIITELCLIKVALPNDKAKNDIIKYSEIYKTKIVDITPKSAILQIIGDTKKIDSFIELMKKYGIREVSRTGITAITRGPKVIGDKK